MSNDSNDRVLTIAEALREGIAEELRRDEKVFCIGEDIGIPGGWGGAFTVTFGLEEEFPERIINTPISEAAIFGAALGAGVTGLIPIADVQYGDFLFCAMDQVVNEISMMRYMSGGEIKVPVVMRAPVGDSNRGAQHAHSMESFFINVPGIKIVCPSNAYDAKGMLKSAVRDGNPVMIFEHKLLYGSKGARAEKGSVDASRYIPVEDYTVPLDKAAVAREGNDISIFSTHLMFYRSLAAAEVLEAEGISCEVVDLRCLSPLDRDTIFSSLKKTGRALVVEESPLHGGWGGEVAATIAEEAYDLLKGPVKRVAAPNTPTPFSPVMDNFYVPSTEKIAQAVRDMM